MKIYFTIILTLGSLITIAQRDDDTLIWNNQTYNIWTDPELKRKDIKSDFTGYDFSSLWTETENSLTYGVIGNNNQRIKMKFTDVKRDSLISYSYIIIGKSMVKNNICDFKGKITVTSILATKDKKHGILLGEYLFKEDSSQIHSGIFKGNFATLFYIENDSVKYDNQNDAADSYRNNQFNGTWQRYHSGQHKVCKWGDYRIPFSDDLDMGAGVFSPTDKYLNAGWQNLRNAFNNDENAIQEELKKWWE